MVSTLIFITAAIPAGGEGERSDLLDANESLTEKASWDMCGPCGGPLDQQGQDTVLEKLRGE